ncbi:unnamed protein product [Rotaria sp. Silwood1]|nr:unnamed protein product [Rotaria sp. Silwood1]
MTIRSNAGKSSSSLSLSTSPLPINSSILTQQFADIIRRYKYYCQHIQRLRKETDKSYNEINDTRVLAQDKISNISVSKSDGEYLDALKTRPLALIICSQSYNGKSRFVNELLNEQLLPESPLIDKNDVVRMVRIKRCKDLPKSGIEHRVE